MSIEFTLKRGSRGNIDLYLGVTLILSIMVYNRYNYDGKKRMRSNAVYINVSEYNGNRVLGSSHYVSKAIEILQDYSIDPVESGLLDILKAEGWEAEIPDKFKGIQQLELV